MKPLIQKQIYRHYSGFKLATYFDINSGIELYGPRQFLEWIVETESPGQNSLNAAMTDINLFLRYLKACSEIQIERQIETLTALGSYLNRILLMYPSFLAEANQSSNEHIVQISKKLGFTGLAEASVRRHIATLNKFIKFNDDEWISHNSFCGSFELDVFVSKSKLHAQLSRKRTMNPQEKASLLNNSMLASTISGGANKIRRPSIKMPRRFNGALKQEKQLFSKCFPIAHVLDVINFASSYRDICLFSLLAGTGIRTSEALQITLNDVIVADETVQILPYSTRISAYSDLNDNQYSKLTFKGRTSKDVHFLEPFKSIFFSNLYKYIDEERDKSYPKHNFLFVTLARNSKGNPMFQGDSTSHNRTFKTTQNRIGIIRKYSLHSLRHFYGTWLRNYAPHSNGFGYPISIVKQAMGHKSESTTEGYALPDKKLFIKNIMETNNTLKLFGFDLKMINKLVNEG